MHNRPVVLTVGLTLVVAMLVVSTFSHVAPSLAFSSSTLARDAQTIEEANLELRRAIMAVREAEAAGADEDQLKDLVERLNTILWMIDRAQHLLIRGDIEGAIAEAERSLEDSKAIVLDAARLRDQASQRTYYGRIFTFGMVPVASLLVTVITHYGWKWWREHEINRTMRMEIRGLKESEEET